MNDSRIFAWDNYDDNPLDAIGVNTIPTQKEATYAPATKGELVTDAFDTFMSNGDEYAYPQVVEVAGEEAKVLVFGEGFISPEPQPEPPSANGCMYLEAAQANSTVSMVSTLETAPDLEYSTDGVTWQEWQHTTADGTHTFDTITLGAVGDKVYFRGDNPNGLAFLPEGTIFPNFSNFVLTGSINGGGNIMSLLDKTMALTVVPQTGFTALFAIMGEGIDPVLITAPAMDTITAIGNAGCSGMYMGCAALTSAASMPSLTTIGDKGCATMYTGCAAITSAADMTLLTTIGNSGCFEMYTGCTSLTTAASMPSLTTIGDNGCDSMYAGCIFDMSDDGSTLNFAFPTPPVTAGETTYSTAYDIAEWMGNTNGFTNP